MKLTDASSVFMILSAFYNFFCISTDKKSSIYFIFYFKRCTTFIGKPNFNI